MEHHNRYSGISILNHWVAAILVIVMWTLALAARHAPTEGTEDYIMSIHIGVGFFTFLFILWRVTVRIYEGFPANAGLSPMERKASYVVHRLLLILITLQVFTGPLYLFTEGEGVNVFDWFTVYIPLESLAFLHEPMEVMHVVAGLYLIPGLILLHFFGALKHYLFDRNQSKSK